MTKNPEDQAAYNQVFRQQLTEVLTRYGSMLEVWFDGSCKVPMSDILKKYAKKATTGQNFDYVLPLQTYPARGCHNQNSTHPWTPRATCVQLQ